MNPYFLRFFDIGEKKPLPVIRMVFALASETGIVQAIPAATTGPSRPAKEGTAGSPAYTAYDIWCAGAYEKTFGVIKGNEATYEKLLKIHKVFPTAYTTGIPEAETIRRQMHPGASVHPSNWNNWNKDKVGEISRVDNADETDFNLEEPGMED